MLLHGNPNRGPHANRYTNSSPDAISDAHPAALGQRVISLPGRRHLRSSAPGCQQPSPCLHVEHHKDHDGAADD
jgi:hypothetical protein